MSSSTNVVSATSDVLQSAAETLALAFDDNPWTSWVVPADDHPARLLELFELQLAHAHAYGRVLTTPDASGVIALMPADAPAPARRTLNRITELHGDLAHRLETPSAGVRPRGSWRIETLGVRPEQQRLGIASSLLVHALTETNELGATVTLETSDERNLRLYERYGFSVVEHQGLDGGPDVWTMERRR